MARAPANGRQPANKKAKHATSLKDFISGMYEPLRLVSDTYPGVPQVRVQGAMALVIAVSILWALIWLTYRAYQVCLTPNDILVEKLGLDIPPTPEVTLEEIGAREIRIAWKYPDLQNSIHKHAIQVNGVRVGDSKRSETAVSLSNLNPGHIYHICVIAISSANFQTSSAVIHVRTNAAPFSQDQDDGTCGTPAVQAYVPKSTPLMSPSAPIMSREHSGGQSQGKRSTTGRKAANSTASQEQFVHPLPDDGKVAHVDSGETVEQLAERLKGLQQENETVDKQIFQEEKEYDQMLRELEEQKNDLKQKVKEKDEASGDLRKHVNKLESVNRTAQSERSKRERLLQQKETERKKRNEDIIRWDAQIVDIKKEFSRIQDEKSQVGDETTEQVEKYRHKIVNQQSEMKNIDDDIKIKGSRIKLLEEERRRQQGDDSEEGKELDRLEKEREKFWDVKIANLRSQYASLISVHSQAQQQYYEAQERLKWVTTQRSNTAAPYGPLPPLELDLNKRTSSHRRSRHRSSLNSNVSSPVSFPLVDPTYGNQNNYNQVGNNSPTFPSGPAFFNINNGMTIPDPSGGTSPVRTDASNPPMSPRADALLPSDLLGDEEQPSMELNSSTKFPSLGGPTTPFDSLLPNSPSPVSSGSRPTSLFVSPHESLHNLHEAQPQVTKDATSQPSSDAAQSASRRLSGLFGFNRQRGKTLADGPPLLGTLKPGQSQSFPRNLEDEFDPIGTRRRRLSYAGNWANPMTNLFPRSSTSHVTTDSSSDRLPAGRRAMFPNFFTSGRIGSGTPSKSSIGQLDSKNGYNQFSPRHDPIDPSILGAVRRNSLSPRPSSTYSFENHLPRPTTDNQPFGWPSSDRTAGGNSVGLDWLSPSAWSRSQSRRPSFQFGSSGHLPLGLPPTEVEVLETSYEPQRPIQAPIGTRPPSSHRPVTPKLNPTAPSFKTIFGKKSEKTKNKESGDPPRSRDHDTNPEEGSPPESHRSKDSRSIRTTTTESRESLERMSSATPSELTNTKESFIQKITRKGSSSKFNMPWKDRSGLFSKKGEPSNQGEIDGDGSSEIQLGKSHDSAVSSTVSTDNKSSKSSLGFGFIRKSKKADKAPSESSEKASEAGDESMSEDF